MAKRLRRVCVRDPLVVAGAQDQIPLMTARTDLQVRGGEIESKGRRAPIWRVGLSREMQHPSSS